MLFKKTLELPTQETALPGRAHPIPTAETHFVNGRPLKGPYPEGLETAYFGMGWMPGAENWLGSYGGYPDEQVNVTYFSPTVMSWSESGMLFCGGAYPEVHTYLTTLDVRTGKDLDLSKIFRDSKMGDYRWEPGQSLIDLAIARRSKDEYAFGEECGIDELIATSLAVTFKEGDIAVFTLQGLPHVIQACQDDIFEAPLAELKPYLAPTATEFFPSLGN